jgi:hypothetical protein
MLSHAVLFFLVGALHPFTSKPRNVATVGAITDQFVEQCNMLPWYL